MKWEESYKHPKFCIFHETFINIFQCIVFCFQVSNSTETTVVLSKVTLSSSGRYRCEVSGEAPEFRTVTDHGVMVVVGKCSKLI